MRDIQSVNFRAAVGADAAALSTLAFASKASWGYDAAFMERIRAAVTVTAHDIRQWTYVVAGSGDDIAGFYSFRTFEGEPYLHDFWVASHRLATGIGKRLWQHAATTAKERRLSYFLIESDPFAEPFYVHMGAVRIGMQTSLESGRSLPLLRYTLDET